MKRLKLLGRVFKRTRADRILYGYVAALFLAAVFIMNVEPGINNYSDSLWYCYTMGVTIGFGDIVATTLLGRIISVILSLYSLLLIGLIPGIVVNYYMAYIRVKEEEAMDNFLDKLEDLENLSHEELARISAGVRALEKRKN